MLYDRNSCRRTRRRENPSALEPLQDSYDGVVPKTCDVAHHAHIRFLHLTWPASLLNLLCNLSHLCDSCRSNRMTLRFQAATGIYRQPTAKGRLPGLEGAPSLTLPKETKVLGLDYLH